MSLLLIILSIFYSLVLLWLIRGLSRLKKGENREQFTASVIIAARNEEMHIAGCLNALKAQDYPMDKLEIIVVDDRSTDDTAKIVMNAMKSQSNLRILQIKETDQKMSPKKHALQRGIQEAKGEILIFTDADCLPSPKWVKTMVSHFEPKVGLVAGFSPLERTRHASLFTGLVQLDALALACVSAGSFGAGYPLTCNARNLSYRKSVFEEIGGFRDTAHLVSGDDDLLLHQIRQKTNRVLRYAFEAEARVPTLPPMNVSQFIHQRIRHASKGRHYPEKLKWGLVAVYLYNVLLLGNFFCVFWKSEIFLSLLAAFVLKTSVEYILISRGATLLQYQGRLRYFPIAALLHIPYVVIFGLWGQFGKFRWKSEPYASVLRPEMRTLK